MRYTRRGFLTAAAAGALGTAGVYELVDRFGASPARQVAAAGLPAEQHLLDGVSVVHDNGISVLVPPLHHQIVTARVRATDLGTAQGELEHALAELDRTFEPTPAGLGITVAWGLPYFERHVPEAWAKHGPADRRAGKAALLPAIRFPSDPKGTILEENDVAVLLRSDTQAHVDTGAKALFEQLRVFEPTSIRKGFAGGGFEGRQSLPKRMAMAAGVPGADLIPDTAELFLGFTSTQRANLGPGRIANLETLGYTDAAGGYFHGGTHMHLSHIFEDLEAWYLNFDFQERIATTFRPGLKVRDGAQTVAQAARDATDSAEVERDFHRSGRIGHSSSIQPASRLAAQAMGPDGTVYAKGTAIPQRADFNTLDNPFFWSERGVDRTPSAGVHFVVFNPTSDDFHRNRLAMDGVLPGGARLPLAARSRAQGLNSVLQTTHRQNFLVPPRRHRSFPLAEL
jgi:hypothetical protein